MNRPPRVPIGPLLEAIAADTDRPPAVVIHEATGIHASSVRRACMAGTLTVWLADTIAIRTLNTHPSLIWGDDWLDQDSFRDGAIVAIFEAMRAAT